MRHYTIILALRPSASSDATIPGHEFLMVRNRRRGDRLELPGGGLEPGEDPLAGARRELVEETGHDWTDPMLVQRRAGAAGDGFVYVCRLGEKVGIPEPMMSGMEYWARLPPRERLSFPDDPYPELFAAAQAHLAKPPTRSSRP